MPRGQKLKDREQLSSQAGLMYLGGMTVRDIMAELHIAYGTAYNLVRDSGVKFRARSSRRRAAA